MLPSLQLDARSETPLYRQLYEQLRSLIQSGLIQRGERLPATRELAGWLGLNRATVSAAYELLESDGLIKGHVGRGSFVEGGQTPLSRIAWQELAEAPAAGLPAPALGSEGISFASSRPDEALFPLSEFRACCEEVISADGLSTILQLGSPAGHAPLRQYLLGEAHVDGNARAGDDVVITSGCQQALDLLARVLIRPGDPVVVEDPVYPGLRDLFTAAGARLMGAPVGPQGPELHVLERLLEAEHPRLLVVSPNFQNPTGATMPLEARERLLRLAYSAGVLVVENDIYGALRYEGEPLASLKHLDPAGEVIFLGSFSKAAFPGLRVGWVIGPPALMARLKEAKQRSDLHTDQLSQAVFFRFAESGRLAAHLDRVRVEGARRLAAVLAACREHLPEGSRWTQPEGGMNVWVRLPEPLDAGELLPRAERAGVNYLPGKYFAVGRAEPGALRLSFAGLPPERIREGVAILGEIFKNELGRVRAARLAEPARALV
ncbi:MAG: PLP-dependent aminotransferase family protein [Acidobacteria bacterium]|nr:PLP-dependent aminotransferase family protein [Acidobacteriota bacterium]